MNTYITFENLVILSEKDEGKIMFVSAKVAAGYLHDYAELEYIKLYQYFHCLI